MAPPLSTAAHAVATAAATSISLAPVFTPQGHLLLAAADEASAWPGLEATTAQRLQAAFALGSGQGLLQLGAGEVASALPPALAHWREFAARYVTGLCTAADALGAQGLPEVPAPSPAELQATLAATPPMTGAEYLSADALLALWAELGAAFAMQLAKSGSTVQALLTRYDAGWNLVGRVHFNLAENRKDEDAPFAFMATYTTRLSAQAKPQHVPLGRALAQFAGASKHEPARPPERRIPQCEARRLPDEPARPPERRIPQCEARRYSSELLALLAPVQRASQHCAWLKTMVDAGEIFHPLRWTPTQALALLRDAPALQAAGIVLRMPARWRAGMPARAQAAATIGAAAPSVLSQNALLDFELQVTLDGETLTAKEIKELLAQSDGLALVRGQWTLVDRDRLKAAMDRFEGIARSASEGGLSFAQAMRLISGAHPGDCGAAGAGPDDAADWSQVSAGPWLAHTLAGLRDPQSLAALQPGAALQATLRPYQDAGLRWLHLLSTLGLGACLADDMGLGKTIQVLALLLVLKQQGAAQQPNPSKQATPNLLVAPASLLTNWSAEAARFAPSLKILVAHPSALPADEFKALTPARLAGIDLVITSYGSLLRAPALLATDWGLAVIDEAQAIKNANAKQTRAVKQIRARARIALTGTPIENRLGDLWSIFDFINPGLLGSAQQFSAFSRQLAARPHQPFAPLRALVQPYILRRMKTDKSVIQDLPDKTEMRSHCALSRKQAALYQEAVDDMAQRLQQADGMQRRGLVLAMLMRFKQICNHPSQWLGDGAWLEADSGKWARLRELAEVIAAKQEKVLVFTQFRETCAPLAQFLQSVFGRAGLVLHGETAVAQRQALVRRFQDDATVPFFVLSLKAGGAGLNLTAAAHVIHFDRWWNPAVENQATDRAFRIGQTRNVLVHKFVCRGTVEEKIDALIESKRQLASDVLAGGAELLLTEMGDADLLKLVALDLNAALAEN